VAPDKKISSISGLVYRVRDLGKTVDFYESLGFRVVADAGEPEPGPALYLKVDDIDDYYGALLANGFTPSTEPRKQRSGAREFLINDPNGNSLAFFGK
jgi:catechol 2,3-dioxygenase-like lactoylglutathione lyase family enzyme